MGWAGRMGRPGLCGMEVGRAEQSRVIRVQPVEVAVQQGARGRGGSATALFSDGTGPPGFEPGFEAPEASVMSKLYYGPASSITGQRWACIGFSPMKCRALGSFGLARGWPVPPACDRGVSQPHHQPNRCLK